MYSGLNRIRACDLYFLLLVRVKTLNGKTFDLLVKSSDTVNIVKTKIQENEDIQPNQQILMFNGDQLKDDEHTLAYYGIENQSIIYLLSAGQCSSCTSLASSCTIVLTMSKACPLNIQKMCEFN